MKKTAFWMLALALLSTASAYACGMEGHSEGGKGESAETETSEKA